MRDRPWRTLRVAFCGTALLLSSCAVQPDSTDAPQGATTPDASGLQAPGPYLDEGPNTRIDLGPGRTSLLEALKEAKERVAVLEGDLKELRLEKNGVETRLAKVERERDQERTARISAEAQHRAATDALHENEARLLDLAIQKAQLEEKLLELQVATYEKELQQKLERAGGYAAPQAGGR